jgi:hypothetical protein
LRRLGVVLFAVLVAAGGVVTAGVTEAPAEPDAESGVVENTTEGRFEAGDDWGASSYGRPRP